jgi:CDP-diacylglycerol--glycerol-3-phosphate 3-phosphatidyltransferase
MSSLTLLLMCKDGGEGQLVQMAATAGPALLVVAAWLTVHSLAIYMRGLWKHFAKPSCGGAA